MASTNLVVSCFDHRNKTSVFSRSHFERQCNALSPADSQHVANHSSASSSSTINKQCLLDEEKSVFAVVDNDDDEEEDEHRLVIDEDESNLSPNHNEKLAQICTFSVSDSQATSNDCPHNELNLSFVAERKSESIDQKPSSDSIVSGEITALPFRSMASSIVGSNDYRTFTQPFDDSQSGVHFRVRTYCLRCDQCGLYLGSKLQLRQHCAAYHQIFAFACPRKQCDKTFDKYSSLREHLRGEHGVTQLASSNRQNWHCSACPKAFVERRHLARHWWKYHQIGVFACPISGCDLTLVNVTRSTIRGHLNARHYLPPNKRHVCNFPHCGKTMKSRYYLEIHEANHFKNLNRTNRSLMVYSLEQVAELERIFDSGQRYLRYETRQALASQLSLTESSVEAWFEVRRLKEANPPNAIESTNKHVCSEDSQFGPLSSRSPNGCHRVATIASGHSDTNWTTSASLCNSVFLIYPTPIEQRQSIRFTTDEQQNGAQCATTRQGHTTSLQYDHTQLALPSPPNERNLLWIVRDHHHQQEELSQSKDMLNSELSYFYYTINPELLELVSSCSEDELNNEQEQHKMSFSGECDEQRQQSKSQSEDAALKAIDLSLKSQNQIGQYCASNEQTLCENVFDCCEPTEQMEQFWQKRIQPKLIEPAILKKKRLCRQLRMDSTFLDTTFSSQSCHQSN